MRLFEAGGEARQYLADQIPPKDMEKQVNLAPLMRRLFDIPENLSPGHYEFTGEGGLKIIFDLVDANHSFDRCWLIYGNDFGQAETGPVSGNMRPIYAVTNIAIRTNNFEFKRDAGSRYNSTLWLPNLKSVDSELLHNKADVDRGYMYLIGETGLLSRPVDLLGFFHELGHIETRTVESINAEYATYSNAGDLSEKKAAYELQREKDANAWMVEGTHNLFEDLDISSELVEGFTHAQLSSYHEVFRKKFDQTGIEGMQTKKEI